MKEEEQGEQSFDASQYNLRNKGVRTAAGRLHKGCIKDAFTKLSIGSIPSNYQSIIYRFDEKKGFGTGQKRFLSGNNASQAEKEENEYQNQNVEPVKKIHASHSSKGFGPLIAKEKRDCRKYPMNPGPGRYFDPASKVSTAVVKQRTCFTRERQNFKRKELAFNKENYVAPGPGCYESEVKADHGLDGCKSSFITKAQRDGYIPKNNSPGPGCYQVAGEATPKQEQKKAPLQGELFTKLSKEKAPRPKHFLPRHKQPQVPGPGSYDQEAPNYKPLYERIKISHNFIQNGRARFDDMFDEREEVVKSPTACTYTVPSVFDKMEKKLIEMSPFMSESKRGVFEGSSPCAQICYDTGKETQKNFHFNLTSKWV